MTAMNPEEARRAWAARFTSRCTTAPPGYGTLPWLELDDADPRKVAAVVLAAEFAVTTLEERKAAEDAAWHARRAAHRASWTGRGFRPDPVLDAEVEADFRRWAS